VNLNTLLDHVYFDTEPMENAQRGEILDFSQLKSSGTPVTPRFNEEKLRQIRAKIGERTRALGLTRNGLHIPAVDIESQRAWAEEDHPMPLRPGTPVRFS
jgi:hypothetical protein